MMDPWKRIHGIQKVELVSAQQEQFLRKLNESGVEVFDFEAVDPLKCRFWLRRKDIAIFTSLCRQTQSNGTVLARRGLYWLMKSLSQRKLLVIGCVLLVSASLYFPRRIFFVSVSGNHSVPTRKIIEQAESAGISFGASRAAVRSEKVKNKLLSSIPELKWVGVNTYGCVAEISVREREPGEKAEQSHSVSSIVSGHDGFVISATATRGNLLVRPGQAVKAGDVLISGYTDCGISIRAEAAEGEILAQTARRMQVTVPLRRQHTVMNGKQAKKISLLLGKKRIFLWKCSGISPASCGRMYEEYYITLPGGFRLPAALCIERFAGYDPVVMELDKISQAAAAQRYAGELLVHRMSAGRILQQNLNTENSDGLLILYGDYVCLESIGRVRQEEIGEQNGKND